MARLIDWGFSITMAFERRADNVRKVQNHVIPCLKPFVKILNFSFSREADQDMKVVCVLLKLNTSEILRNAIAMSKTKQVVW